MAIDGKELADFLGVEVSADDNNGGNHENNAKDGISADKPGETGGQVEPAADAGDNGQADAVEGSADENGDGQSPQENVVTENPPAAKPEEDKKSENSRNAAARRKAEKDAEELRLRKEYEDKMRVAEDAAFASAFQGRVNPYSGKPILTKKDFEEYNKAYQAEQEKKTSDQTRESLKSAGIDENAIRQIVSEMPEVKRAKEIADAADASRKANEAEMIRKLIEKDISEIAKMDPSITNVETLLASPKGKAIEARVKSGKNTYLDAWKIENFDNAFGTKTAAARQAAINSANSKEHLASVKAHGQGAVSIPSDIKAQYAAFGITDADEQTKAYTKYLNSKKG